MTTAAGPTNPEHLAERLRNGDMRSLARALTWVERRADGFETLLGALLPHAGQAQLVGVSGPPGAGKSTLIGRLAEQYGAVQRVAVLSVDPTSVVSGGALLGDRIRMTDVSLADNVFVRSVATRGTAGGLSLACWDLALVLDAAGYDPILIETVGAGQGETEVRHLADTTVQVEPPGLGDHVQALKAGMLEVSDIVVVNKADRPDSARTAARIRQTLALGMETGLAPHAFHGQANDTGRGWVQPVLLTDALAGTGIDELQARIAEHRDWLCVSGTRPNAEHRRAARLLNLLVDQGWQARRRFMLEAAGWDDVVEAVADRQQEPHAAVRRLLQRVFGDGSGS